MKRRRNRRFVNVRYVNYQEPLNKVDKIESVEFETEKLAREGFNKIRDEYLKISDWYSVTLERDPMKITRKF